MQESGKSPLSISWHQIWVSAAGVLVFVLFLLADKTHLGGGRNTGGMPPEMAGMGAGSVATPSTPPPADLFGRLQGPFSPEASAAMAAADQAKGSPQEATLDRTAVEALQADGRLDAAAVYADRVAAIDSSAKNRLVAGALFRNASLLPDIQKDTALFRIYSNSALFHLEKASHLEPQNEDILIEWGMALIESQQPGSAMLGIGKLREVTEKNPNNEEAFFRLGVYSMETNQMDKAEGRFRRVLEINPNNQEARYYLAVCCRDLGKMDEFKSLMSVVASQQQDSVLARVAREMLEK